MQPDPREPPVTVEAVIALLRDNRMRGFKIDVETDTLIEADQDAEKQRRIELVTAVGEYLGKVGPLAVQMPQLASLVGGMLQFSVRGFKVGSELEDLIEKTMDDIQQSLANPQPPQPDPETQAKLEGEKLKAEVELRKADMEAQQAAGEHQARIVELEQSMAMEREKHAMEMEMMREKHMLEVEKMRANQEHMAAKLQFERERVSMQAEHETASHEMDMESREAEIEAKRRAAEESDS